MCFNNLIFNIQNLEMSLQEYEEIYNNLVIPFNSTKRNNNFFISKWYTWSARRDYHLYHDGWNKDNNNLHLGPPTETSSIFLQAVELDTSNDESDTTDYKATEAMPIQLSSDQITALKVANGSETDNNILLINMKMNLSSVSDPMRQPEITQQIIQIMTSNYIK